MAAGRTGAVPAQTGAAAPPNSLSFSFGARVCVLKDTWAQMSQVKHQMRVSLLLPPSSVSRIKAVLLFPPKLDGILFYAFFSF